MAHHFFLPGRINPGEPAVLEGENAHHALRVLRLKEGETITLADSSGQGYLAEVAACRGDRVIAAIKSARADPEPGVKVTLYQGWPKGDKLDLIIEKCTELGVARIVVLATERSVPRPGQQACEQRRQRWQQKARAAACQSRRHRIPVVEGPLELTCALAAHPAGSLLLVPWEEEPARNLQVLFTRTLTEPSPAIATPFPSSAPTTGVPELALLIGPEGGLSAAEIDLARRHGGLTITLGPRILRTETAALACLAAMMYALEELG